MNRIHLCPRYNGNFFGLRNSRVCQHIAYSGLRDMAFYRPAQQTRFQLNHLVVLDKYDHRFRTVLSQASTKYGHRFFNPAEVNVHFDNTGTTYLLVSRVVTLWFRCPRTSQTAGTCSRAVSSLSAHVKRIKQL